MRVILALEKMHEDRLANQIRNDDWKALYVMSKIYSLDSFDMQTLQIGMHLLPTSKKDDLRILNKLSDLDIPERPLVQKILSSSHDHSFSAEEIRDELKVDDYYSRLILNCVEFIDGEDCESHV